MPNIFPIINYSRIDCLARINIQNYMRRDIGKYYNEETEYLVLWYGQIYYHRRKLVQVYFLNCQTNKQYNIGIPIELILKLPIGTIWKNGRCHQKYDFETIFTTIDAHDNELDARANLSYTNHYGISKNRGEYILKPSSYPVKGLEKDSNTNLVIHNGTYNIVIPSVLFFVAHYGVSKEINRVLISFHMEDVEEILHLNDKNDELITIPDRCVIGDTTFLYYLKTDDYTQRVVRSLNARMLRNDRVYYPLKTEPYHNQQIQLKIKVLRIDEQTMLCTEILGISMPQGRPIDYRIDRGNSVTYKDGIEPETSQFTPIYNTIESEEIILEAERDANNITTAVVRQRIEPIGEIRKLIQRDLATLDEILSSCSSGKIPIFQDQPNSFAVGEHSNSNGDIGRLQVLAYNGIICPIENNFERLLRYAQSLKVSTDYSPVVIDCVNFANEKIFIGEKVVGMDNCQYDSKVNSIFVMRLMTRIGIFYIFDCDKQDAQTQGIVIKVLDEEIFLKQCIMNFLSQLFENDGRLRNKSRISRFGSIKYFKHTNTDSSNWIKTALDKF